ncbi:ABC transporter substrate-binding protein [Intrasporangium oryzae NRRL B-24470]|uniref:ABC transporter substrate-binding protein n=1 Tax=Intrasporangium oryzae NRRL B-24470 TaxID=1386089 RepID=W9G4M5_9MICO|nr:ABC transporter substrate-binding protein [Intrasporangium oryzae]EWT01071.1 ABC transporter substrate-binding protein [Intrasporangium oryzae NRRL B-24470]
MTISRRTTALAVLAVTSVLSVAACGGGGTTTGSGNGSATGSAAAGQKGGTVYWLTKRPAEHLDPQRTYIGRDLANENRLFYRDLVSFPVGKTGEEATKPVADLATDTGTSSEGGKVWKFTLKDGVKWQDGKDITCEDLKYGLSRGFATDVITGGPNYQLGYLDVPQKDGLPVYNGPYKKTGQADFDKAVACEGKTITYHFNKPWADFPLAIASLRSFAPYRADQDKGDQSNYAIFSSGPYQLQGTWQKGKGGTFVRNPNYDPKTDQTGRMALPDKIVITEGLTNEIINQRLIADSGDDKYAVTDRKIPGSMYSQIDSNPTVKSRSTLVNAPFVDYLLPNFNSDVMKNPKVRDALKLATDKTAYITASGGDKYGVPAKSIVNPDIVGYKDNAAFTGPDAGDTAAAKAMLQSAGVTLPVKIKYTYSGGTPESDNAAAALKQGWDKAGFSTTLDPLTDTYYDVIQNPNTKSDVYWGGWGADWPSAATVTAPLFDSRVNGVGTNPKSNGQDYGNYKSDAVNSLFDQAAKAADVQSAATVYAQADDQLGKDVAYIPLTVEKFYFLHGSGITGYAQSAATSGYPDLGSIGVKK